MRYSDLRRQIKTAVDREKVRDMLEYLGYEVDRNYKFRIRSDERTPSASIRKDGLIKDFGGDFTGDIVSFLADVKGMELKEATLWVAERLGLSTDTAPQSGCDLSRLSAGRPAPAPASAPSAGAPDGAGGKTNKRESAKEEENKKEEERKRKFLSEMDKNFRKAFKAHFLSRNDEDTEKMAEKLLELFADHLWRMRGFSDVLFRFVGYSTKYQSLTISLKEGDAVKAVCVRQATDRAGNVVKWKTYGSKRFIPHRIFDFEDPTVFVGFGVGEFLLFELLKLNYVAIQSDAIAHNLHENPYAPDLKEKIVVILQDNDQSCREAATAVKKYYEKENVVLEINLENVLDKNLPKGYDFRDFCNEIAKEVTGGNPLVDPQYVRKTILENLIKEIEILMEGVENGG